MDGMVKVSACKYLKGYWGRVNGLVLWGPETELGLLCGCPDGQISSLKMEELTHRQSSSKMDGCLREVVSSLAQGERRCEHFERIWKRDCFCLLKLPEKNITEWLK